MANNASIVTRDVIDLCKETNNVYESIVVLTKRARQIAVKEKEELSSKLAEFATTVDNLEEIFENKEQIEISKYYEKLPKPSAKSVDEFFEDKIVFKQPITDEAEGDLLI
jgi:DNA-directed RNA polymerase subunit K/omega